MTEIKIANYTLTTVLLLVMISFCISLCNLNETKINNSHSTFLAGYIK